MNIRTQQDPNHICGGQVCYFCFVINYLFVIHVFHQFYFIFLSRNMYMQWAHTQMFPIFMLIIIWAKYVIRTSMFYHSTCVKNCVMKKLYMYVYVTIVKFNCFMMHSNCISICRCILYAILIIKLYVNLLLFIRNLSLNKLQKNPIKILSSKANKHFSVVNHRKPSKIREVSF